MPSEKEINSKTNSIATSTNGRSAKSKYSYWFIWTSQKIWTGKRKGSGYDQCIHKIWETIAFPDKQAETVAMEIFIHWICRFGSPVEIHSSNGTEFVNKLSKELFKLLDIKHSTTTPGHPQCNAQAEVFLRQWLNIWPHLWTTQHWTGSNICRQSNYHTTQVITPQFPPHHMSC